MRPEFLLNFSTHRKDLGLFKGEWEGLERFVKQEGFHGIELYPVGEVSADGIPNGLIKGIHLRFFIMLRPILNGDMEALKEIFGDLDVARRFYGGLSKEVVIQTYVAQLDLASDLGASYVVFHPVEVMLDQVYDWSPRHSLRETLALHCDLMNEALSQSHFHGLFLFENLWWPWGLTLKSEDEFEFILSKMDYDRCGIVLDTGHMILSEGGYDHEEQAIEALIERLKRFSSGFRNHIHALHLTCTLSGTYTRQTRAMKGRRPDGLDFWKRLERARRHVMELDRHDPFTKSGIGEVLDLVDPAYVVFEFRYGDLHTWKEKIRVQKAAIGGRFFP